jgi:outer membrane receptor for ferrienterochelin and colicins
MNIIAGGRYDDHSAYHSQLSPKFALQYDVNKWLSVRGSAGVGFKAPDFRQLYLNFTNASVGYSVFGTQDLEAGIARLQAQGQIQELLADPASFKAIKAESSVAYNIGAKVKATDQLSFTVNAFRNDVKDLIDTKVVAIKTNGQFVYSYYNIARVFTEGTETEATYYPVKNICISFGHQYLIAKDKAVVEQLKKGEVYARDPKTQATTRVTPSMYGGLFNRSRHMLNAKVFYEDKHTGLSASVRAIYRGRYGYADLNNNGILDADNEYVSGYVTCNVSVGKNITPWAKVQVGCDNILNYKNAAYIPTLPGRLLWASLGLSISKK